MVIVHGEILKILSFDCFCKYVENTLCFTLARVSLLTGISLNQLTYWDKKDFLKVAAEKTHFGTPSGTCKNFHLPQIKMAFAIGTHLSNSMALANARARVSVDSATAGLWERNYEEKWRETFRANCLLQRDEVIEIVNHFTQDFLTKEHLIKWLDEGYIDRHTPRATSFALDLVDSYELYAIYVVALAMEKYRASKITEAALTLYANLGNDMAQKSYNIDCNIERGYLFDYAPLEIDLPDIGKMQMMAEEQTKLKPTEPAVISSRKILHDFLHSKFPNYLTIESIQLQTQIEENELLDRIEEMGDGGLVEKRWSTRENAFAFRFALDKMNK